MKRLIILSLTTLSLASFSAEKKVSCKYSAMMFEPWITSGAVEFTYNVEQESFKDLKLFDCKDDDIKEVKFTTADGYNALTYKFDCGNYGFAGTYDIAEKNLMIGLGEYGNMNPILLFCEEN